MVHCVSNNQLCFKPNGHHILKKDKELELKSKYIFPGQYTVVHYLQDI